MQLNTAIHQRFPDHFKSRSRFLKHAVSALKLTFQSEIWQSGSADGSSQQTPGLSMDADKSMINEDWTWLSRGPGLQKQEVSKKPDGVSWDEWRKTEDERVREGMKVTQTPHTI